eukprot:gene14093-18912_t
MTTNKLNSETLAQYNNIKEFDDVTSDNAQYGRVQFWDHRYANEFEPFEWYYGYEYFKETIRENVPINRRVMIAGCGSSNMLGDMAEDGYTDLVGADLSRVAISQLQVRYKDVPAISFFQGTMVDTDLPEGSISAIIDKALFDSLLCTQNGATTIAQYVLEVERLLDDNGVFIVISYGNPEQRLLFLEQYDIDEPFFTPWIIEVQAVMKPNELEGEELDPNDPASLYFVYICQKSPELVKRKKIKEKKIMVKQTTIEAQKKKKAPNLK